jgi:hypothetical protein
MWRSLILQPVRGKAGRRTVERIVAGPTAMLARLRELPPQNRAQRRRAAALGNSKRKDRSDGA